MPAKKDNTAMTFLKGLSPANLILIVLIVSGFVLNEAVFKANSENAVNQNTVSIVKHEVVIEKVEKKVEINKDNIVENRHRGELILQKQQMLLDKLDEIKLDIQQIPKIKNTQ